MREILFRGKRLDNGEWVEGWYQPETTIKHWNGSQETVGVTSAYKVEEGFLEDTLVDPPTVGQYTGLTDKNGKRIFEGDMIKPFDDEVGKMVVEFHHGQFLLCLYGERGYMAEYGWEEEGNYGCFEAEPLSSYGDDIEVIGNIHDNPEMLKGGEG